jgi:hypothetical protein
MNDKNGRPLQVHHTVRFLPYGEKKWRTATVRSIEGNEARVDDGEWLNDDCRTNGARMMAWVPSERLEWVNVAGYTAQEMKTVLDDNKVLRERIAVLEGQLALLSGATGLVG